LNRFVYEALTTGERSSDDERVFNEWSDKHALSKAWSRATDAAEIEDLRFHDLRRWFASVLEDLGDGEEEEAVPREVVKYLLGHQPADTLERHYLVRSKGWAKKLRRAVDQLGDRYEQFIAEGLRSAHSN
jgi:integrase